MSTENDDQEIRVSVDGNGNLVAAGSQLADYQQRGEELNGTRVWDFHSRVDKVKKTSDRRRHKPSEDSEAEMDALEVEENRPRVLLRAGYRQAKSHILRVRAQDDILIPVPIGPGIPRRDKKKLREKYCRLMLIFFKPWRHAQDLKKEHSSWEDAFDYPSKPVQNQFSSKCRICKFFMSAAIAGMIILPNDETEQQLQTKLYWNVSIMQKKRHFRADEVSGKKRRAVNSGDAVSAAEELEARKRQRIDEELRHEVEEHTRKTRGSALVDLHARAGKRFSA
ncbi:hypothetical protein B0H14DRAFT_2628338 [Mycena olivaceomarginata]|nr:hypothetical protein B0H14DRAFT_2628338 [Mycena olivaceomarginata]